MGKLKKIETVALNVRFTKNQVKEMDTLLKKSDRYRSRSDVVRDGFNQLIEDKKDSLKPATEKQSCSQAEA